MEKKWLVRESVTAELKAILSDYHPIIAQLLYNRELRIPSEIERFLNPAYEKLHDPFLFKDMNVAVERIWQAICRHEKILVHGDYDADGVTSAAVLVKTLKILNADVDVFIPHREEDGYGINMKNLNKFIVQRVKLLITVDCGVTNVLEIDALNAARVDVIVTDHHEPLVQLPKALAIINPKVADSGYPFRSLSGAGIAYKVAQALLKNLKSEIRNPKFEISDEDGSISVGQDLNQFKLFGGIEGFQKWLLDIVAVGTVADVVPLVDENRILVKWGLVVLKQTRNLGLKKLLEVAGIKRIDSSAIAFQIAPRLNAAGRMNHASAAFALLTTENEAEAERLAKELQKNNQDRQKAIEIALTQAKKQILEMTEEKSLFVFDENWSAGLVGLIAGKLCDEYYRPVFAMTKSQGRIVGSGRSIVEFNIMDGLKSAEILLARYGGHAGACGFTLNAIEMLGDFKTAVKQRIEKDLFDKILSPFLEIDAAVAIKELTLEILEQIMALAPFGEGNGRPLFLIRDLQIAAMDTLGEQNNHLRLMIKEKEPRLHKMMFFNEAVRYLDKIQVGDTIDVVCELGINEWNGNREMEFKIVDLKVRS
ncbi:single-stranded-DNA-specific exonuclease RecJ [Candidatus Falkowbacteria bacterium]|nr:single-stranded-DNA-specific exonuclease RecJ [Candidatus Falkowbacteria bacterium]